MKNVKIEHDMNPRCAVASGTPRRRTNRDRTRIDMSPILLFTLSSVQGSHGNPFFLLKDTLRDNFCTGVLQTTLPSSSQSLILNWPTTLTLFVFPRSLSFSS